MGGALVDLSPALRVMLLGALVALGPLAWLWVRDKKASPMRRLQALTLLTLFLTFDLVLFGAFTRLTDSGLGCPDWPGCYGSASPGGAHAQISQAQAALPTGPVTHVKAWIEMVHRYLATAVGVLITTLLASTWLLRRRSKLPLRPGLPLLTLAWVCLQGAFGALTVTMKLFPLIVTLHLMGGLVLLALLTLQAASSAGAAGQPPTGVDRGTRRLLVAVFALLAVQVALGGWVSTNYAVLACNTFPSCQGGWWPPMDFRHGFTLWRPLGQTGQGEQISFAALTAIHYTHRLMAYAVVAALALLALRLSRFPALATQRNLLLLLGLGQVVSGVTNVVMGWPLAAAVAHTGGAAALVVTLTWTVCRVRAWPQGIAASRLHAAEASA